MEAEMVPTLTPLLQGADEWGEVLLLLPLLVALEAVLSADNAIALAAISRRLHDPQRQRQALNLGLLLALVFRLGLIVAARWVLNAWPLQLLAAGYLLWLCGSHLLGMDEGSESDDPAEDAGSEERETPTAATTLGAPAAEVSATGKPNARQGTGPTLASIALTLALTDLAFSLDSVAAAVAVTDRLALVMAGGVLGVLALRLTAGLFVRWLEVFSRLETAGYLAVGLVGIRLLLRLIVPDLEIPEWALLLLVASLFLWGFSERDASASSPESGSSDGAESAGGQAHSTGSDADPPAIEAEATGPAASAADDGAAREEPTSP